MVTKNPVFAKWSIKRFQATVINDIWPETLLFTALAALVTCVNKFTSKELVISSGLLTVLGLVLSLVVSFRTSSAYERFAEGRKLWTNINLASRNLATLVWIYVPNDRAVPANRHAPSRLSIVIEKKSMINLVQAFSVSVKHALRGEAGIYYEDLYPLVCFLPRFASQPPHVDVSTDVLPLWQASQLDDPLQNRSFSSNAGTLNGLSHTMSNPGDSAEKKAAEDIVAGAGFAPPNLHKHGKKHRESDPDHILPVVNCDRVLRPARNPPRTTLYDYIPLLIIFKPIIWPFRYLYKKARKSKYKDARPGVDDGRNAFGKKRKAAVIESSVPLEITLFLSSYCSYLMSNNLIPATLVGSFTGAISGLQDCMANLERIRSTPLPFAYQAHLRISMWLYLAFLPFELYATFDWLTIPATAFSAFLLLGFLEIGQEIEDPFGYDENDLDLDEFCGQIRRDLAEIVAHTSPDPLTYIFETWNHPLAPGDQRSAKEMIEDIEHAYHGPDTGLLHIRRTLLESWRYTVSGRNIV